MKTDLIGRLAKKEGFYVGSVAITKYSGQREADTFKKKLESMGIKVYILNFIEKYTH